jgi:hypothetical protein
VTQVLEALNNVSDNMLTWTNSGVWAELLPKLAWYNDNMYLTDPFLDKPWPGLNQTRILDEVRREQMVSLHYSRFIPYRYFSNVQYFFCQNSITPDIDNQRLLASVEISGSLQNEMIGISAWDGNQMVAENEAEFGKPVILSIKKPKLWSPENPFLYDLKITISRNGKPVDQVKSYFAMSKISLDADENGVQRMMLNNQFVFQYGPLDQGWWPDGLYTAPTDESLLFDIVKTKEMGFNMIRKHVKTEPERWYYHCDSIGMLVWQDMPSGDHGGGKWNANPGMEGGSDKTRTGESENIFRTEWNAIIESLYNHPCIVVWVPFNEAWGQFKTVEITKWTMEKDPSRLVNSASGGNFHQAGQILDMHNYPGPVMPKPEIFGASQALALGEFGGLGLPLE